ncbi:MAG TPA: SPFH domain-containing protein [Candidatus Brocadiia bacterium]|nr:SPFH domain-containing protein [Candidatus Brocadiia bacterium]
MAENKNAPEMAPKPSAPGDLPPAAVGEEMDAAMASLATALRFSFLLLKIVMLILIVVYLVSGIFYQVESSEVALALQFGKIGGKGDDRIKKPGGPYWNLPPPLGEVVKISTSPRTMEINTFWPRVSETEREESVEGKDKNKEARPKAAYPDAEDGYLMTGDKIEVSAVDVPGVDKIRDAPAPNLLQARLVVEYTVPPGAAENYFLNVRDAETEKRMVRSFVEASMIQAASGHKIHDLLKNQVDFGGEVKNLLQASLDKVNSGISVTRVAAAGTPPAPPKDVAEAFRQVNSADNEYRSRIDAANGYASDILAKAAGEQGAKLQAALLALWSAEARQLREDMDRARAGSKVKPWTAEELAARQEEIAGLAEAVRALYREPKTNRLLVQGEAARMISEAETYSKWLVNRADGASKALLKIVEKYQGDPQIDEKIQNYVNHRRVQAIAALLDMAKEKYYVTAKQGMKREVRLLMSRHPDAIKAEGKITPTR